MTKGSLLTLTALCVAGSSVGNVFAFTPSVSALPDVIIGDQTPINGLTPGDTTTGGAGSTLENQAATANVFAFPNAFNVFNLVDDTPNGVAGFTSDAALIYRFVASPVTPETGVGGASSNNRISINGTTIGTTPTTVTVAGNASLDFVDVEFSGDAVVVPRGTLTYNFRNNAFDGQITRDVIDVNALTMTVTNNQSRSSSSEFMVYTVNDGPDAISGGLVISSQDANLSGWNYIGALVTDDADGSFSGDTVSGTKPSDTDASVVNLSIGTTDVTGQSYVFFESPAALLPFVNNGTYRLTWTVDRTAGFTADAQVPALRFRYAYGNSGELGGGFINAVGSVAAPTTGGRDYSQIIDLFDVASANAVLAGGTPENSLRAFFETVDFEETAVGGGSVILDNLEIQSLQASALGAGNVERNQTVFNDATTAEAGTFKTTSGTGVTVTRAAGSATITAPGAGGASTLTDSLFGDPLTIDVNGIGIVPFAPSSTSGLFYRADYGANLASNSAAAPLPQILFVINTQTIGGAQLFTSQVNLQPVRANGAGENPAHDATSFSNYLVLPEGGQLNGGSLGNGITASVRMVDSAATPELGGSITVNNIRIVSYPDTLLP